MRTFLIALLSFGLGIAAHHWWVDAPDSGVRSGERRHDSDRESAELAAARAEATKLRGELKEIKEARSAGSGSGTAGDGDSDRPRVSGKSKPQTTANGPRFTDPESEVYGAVKAQRFGVVSVVAIASEEFVGTLARQDDLHVPAGQA